MSAFDANGSTAIDDVPASSGASNVRSGGNACGSVGCESW
jgi:hypothetical protein